MDTNDSMPNNRTASLPKAFLPGLLFSCALVLGAGLWQTHRLVRMADRHMRENLLLVAATLGQNITSERLQALSFTKSDLQNPVFQRLSRQLASASECLGLAGVFTVARRGEDFVFGAESYPEGHPYATPPGTQYQRPPEHVAALFATRQPQVTPLYTDEFGQFITALAPVIDPLTGEVLLAVCCDMDVEQWRRLLQHVRGWSLGFTALILIQLVAGFSLLAMRLRRPMPSRWFLRYSEALLCAGFMMTLTVAAVGVIRFRESRVRESSFSALAQQQASAIMREFYGIRRSIDGLARIFQTSTEVSPAEFSLYASRFTADYAVQAALWMPATAPAAVSRVETEARAEGFGHYQVWQSVPDQPGARMPAAGRPAFYPIRYLEPQKAYAAALGFDMGSEPSRAAALEETLRTGLVSASAPVSFFAASNTPPGFFVMQATASHTQTGAVALAVCIDPLLSVPLNRVAARPGQGLVADLFQVPFGQPPALLTTSHPEHMTAPGFLHTSEPRLRLTAPVFAFGKTFAVVIHPTQAWLAANPLSDSTTAAVAGLLLTAMMTVFVVFLSNRRIALEREVRNRTADLVIAHDNLKSVFSATPVAMMVVDREARLLDANQRAEALFKSKVCECLDEGCGAFLSCVKRHGAPGGCGHGPDCPQCPLRQAVKEVSDGGPSVFDRDMETRVDRAGKTETFHLRFSAAPVRYGSQRRVVVALHDITAWHRTEQLYRTLFLEMDYGIVLYEQVTDGNGRITDFRYTTANPAYERLTGTSAESLTGKTILSRRPDLPAELFATFVRVTEGGQATRFSFHDKARNRHYEGTLFRFESGQLANIFTDVTDRIQAEERLNSAMEETRRLLKETEAARCELLSAVDEQKRTDEALVHERNLLYALMDNLPDRIYFKDIESRFLKISKAHAASLGLAAPEEAIGKSDAHFKPAEVADRTRAKELEIIRTGQPLLAQVEQKQTADGRIHWVSASKAPIKDKDGHVVGLVGISRDITPEIELQQQLQQVYKMDAIGRLAGGVAHDFNNLLQAILGFTEILLAGVHEQDPQYGDLKQIERAAKRAADLTRQLLAFSRKQRVTPQVLNINHIISSTEKMLHRLMGEGIEIIQQLAPDALPVRADPNQIEQIIVNLAVNARDSMPQGGRLLFSTDTVELSPADVKAIPEAVPGIFTRLSVSDTGTGISPDMLPHLFEPFFTSKAQGKGTGLGLSVIYGIVKQNGGWINVDSREGQGTTFRIYLPASHETPEAPDAGSQGQAGITLQGLGKSILLVEDEPGVRSLATLVLQGAGYNVCACESAQEAKAVFEPKAHASICCSATSSSLDRTALISRSNCGQSARPCRFCSAAATRTTACAGNRSSTNASIFCRNPTRPQSCCHPSGMRSPLISKQNQQTRRTPMKKRHHTATVARAGSPATPVRATVAAGFVSLLCAAFPAFAAPVTNTVNVLDLFRDGHMEAHLSAKADLTDPPEKVFQLRDGLLHVSGRGYGYLATKQSFSDYHLVVEFKWGEHTWGNRKDRARDNGVLVHAFGPHGACGGTWITSIEANIIEGGMADIIVIASKLPDGTMLKPSVTCEVALDRDGEKCWKRGAPRQTVTGGRVNWEKRDVDWADKLGFRGKDDLDAPVGEWNRLEVIAKGNTLRYLFNGQVVNEAFDVSPAEGRVCIQTEAAETIFRRWELWPAGSFKETWKTAAKQ